MRRIRLVPSEAVPFLCGEVQVDHLPPGVDPRICSPRYHYPEGPSEDELQCGFQAALNGLPAWLGRPAGERRSIVTEVDA